MKKHLFQIMIAIFATVGLCGQTVIENTQIYNEKPKINNQPGHPVASPGPLPQYNSNPTSAPTVVVNNVVVQSAYRPTELIILEGDTFLIKHTRIRTSIADTTTVEADELWYHDQRLSFADCGGCGEKPRIIIAVLFDSDPKATSRNLTVTCTNAVVCFVKKNGRYVRSGGSWDVSK